MTLLQWPVVIEQHNTNQVIIAMTNGHWQTRPGQCNNDHQSLKIVLFFYMNKNIEWKLQFFFFNIWEKISMFFIFK